MRTLLAGLSLLLAASAYGEGIPESSWRDLQLDRLDEPAPALNIDDGRTLAGLRGHWVILHFWATWCGPCAKELPALDRLNARHAHGSAAVFAVAIDSENEDKAVEFVGKHGLGLSILYERAAQAPDRYWAFGLPVTYLIDPDGRLAARALGARDWDSPAGDALIGGLSK